MNVNFAETSGCCCERTIFACFFNRIKLEFTVLFLNERGSGCRNMQPLTLMVAMISGDFDAIISTIALELVCIIITLVFNSINSSS